MAEKRPYAGCASLSENKHKLPRQRPLDIKKHQTKLFEKQSVKNDGKYDLRGCPRNCPTASGNISPMNAENPLESAAATLLALVPPETAESIRAANDERLCEIDMQMGQAIRNSLGVWDGNPALVTQLNEMGIDHPDDMSLAILRAARHILRGESIDAA